MAKGQAAKVTASGDHRHTAKADGCHEPTGLDFPSVHCVTSKNEKSTTIFCRAVTGKDVIEMGRGRFLH